MFNVQVKKVDEDPHSNINQRFNVTTMKFKINKKIVTSRLDITNLIK